MKYSSPGKTPTAGEDITQNLFKGRNTKAIYQQINNVTDRDIKQLLNMDNEIEKLFDQG